MLISISRRNPTCGQDNWWQASTFPGRFRFLLEERPFKVGLARHIDGCRETCEEERNQNGQYRVLPGIHLQKHPIKEIHMSAPFKRWMECLKCYTGIETWRLSVDQAMLGHTSHVQMLG